MSFVRDNLNAEFLTEHTINLYRHARKQTFPAYHREAQYAYDLLKQEGLGDSTELQTIAGLTLYPHDYFCPLCYDDQVLTTTENTRSIHWYDASWLDERMKKRQKRSAAIRRRMPGKFGNLINKIYIKASYLWEWTVTGQLLKKIKGKLTKKNG